MMKNNMKTEELEEFREDMIRLYDRETLILKVDYIGKRFICNRSTKYKLFNPLINDKYCKWFRIKSIVDLNIKDSNVYVLETLPYDNINLRHQKIINQIKSKYIDKYCSDENVSVVNKALNESINTIRDWIKKKYYEVENTICLMSPREIFKIVNYLWENKRGIIINRERADILKLETFTWKEKAVALVFIDYFKERKKNGYRYPFTKGIKLKTQITKILTYNLL